MVATNSIETVGRQSANLRRTVEDDGFVVCRNIFSRDEITSLAEEADALLQRTDLIDKLNLRCRFQSNCAAGGCVFETFDPVVDIAPRCEEIALDTRMMQSLEEIYGEEACLFKDKLIYKPAGAMGCGLHQDYIAWSGFPRSFLTVVVPIDAATEENGCTDVFPEIHKRGCLSPEDGEYHELPAGLVADVSHRQADPRTGRYRDFRRVPSAPRRAEQFKRPAKAALFELQRGFRRWSAANQALSRLPPLPSTQIRRLRPHRHVLSLNRAGA